MSVSRSRSTTKRNRSCSIDERKRLRRDFRRRQRLPADERTAFDEQRQFARRQFYRRTATTAPKVGEASALKTLHENAQPSAVPEQDLATPATPAHEEEQVAAHDVAPELLLHDPDEPVVALAEIRRLAIGPNADRPRQRDQDRRRINI